MVKIKRILFSFCLLLTTALLYSQSFNVGVSSKNIAMNQRLEITFTIKGESSNFHPPKFDNFSIVSGPNRSSSFQLINGRYSQSKTFNYGLRPNKIGKFKIGSATVKIDGKNYKTEAITITVTKVAQSKQNNWRGNPQQSQPGSQNKQNEKSQSIEEQLADNLFIKAFVSKSNPYKNEQLTLTYKLYYRLQFNITEIKRPKFSGFWIEEVNLGESQRKIEVVNGERYYVSQYMKYILIPQKIGKTTINPLKINSVVRVQSQTQRNDPFSNPFFNNYQNYKYTIKSNAVTINVKALPANKTANYSGLVGAFSMDVSADKTETKTNDPITLTIKVSGRGNLKLLSDFEIDLPSDFEIYEPKIKDNLSVGTNGISGYKTFEYLLVPHVAGKYEIPQITLSYFNPVKKQYKTLSSNEIELKILKGDGTENAPLLTGLSKQEIELRGKDIRFIKVNKLNLQERNRYYFGSYKYFILLILPFLILLTVVLMRKKIIESRRNVALLKMKKATKKAKKQLKAAKKHLKKNNSTEFYISTTTALNGYASDKMGIAAAELTKDKMKEELVERNVSEENIDKFLELIDNCNFARYAPSQANFKLQDIYNQSVELISSIEKEIKQ